MRLRIYLSIVRELLFYSYVSRRGMAGLRAHVARIKVADTVPSPETARGITDAVKNTCVFYYAPVLCLQRAFVTTRLLRRAGVPAHLVLGCRRLPFKSHAWVEVDGRVVIGKTTQLALFDVLDRW